VPAADPEAPSKGAGSEVAGPVGTARKVRLVLMLAFLLALIVVAVLLAAQERAAQRQRRRDVAAALQEMRRALGELNIPKADARWQKVKELEPENTQADELLVPLYFGSGRMDKAVDQFNLLVTDGVIRARAGGAETDPVALAVAARPEWARGTMGELDTRFVVQEGLLANLAQRIADGASSDRERALRLCRWFALHLEPRDRYTMPAEPFLVVWRGFGSPQQLCWTYAEMAGQLGLRCAVVVPPGGGPVRLLQVYPTASAPFLVDPGRGVPLIDPNSREPISLDGAAKGGGYGALLSLSGEEPDYSPEDLGAAVLQMAVHPYALLPRYEAFGRLLSCLSAPPRLSYEGAPLPDGREEGIWPVPLQTIQTYDDPARARELNDAHLWIATVGRFRNLLLLQPDRQAETVLTGIQEHLKAALAVADIKEAIGTLRDEVELVTFWQAANAHDTGELEQAVELLTQYLHNYPNGHWRSVAGALLGESLAQCGRSEEAERAWRDVAPGRRLYGAMRIAGLLPMASAAPTDAP